MDSSASPSGKQDFGNFLAESANEAHESAVERALSGLIEDALVSGDDDRMEGMLLSNDLAPQLAKLFSAVTVEDKQTALYDFRMWAAGELESQYSKLAEILVDWQAALPEDE